MKKVFSSELFKKEKKQNILTHYHDSIELIQILEGSLKCLIQGKEYTLYKDYLCIINQKQLHRLYSVNDENNCSFQRIIIEPNIFTSNKNVYEKYIDPILSDNSFSHIISSSKNIFTKEIISFINLIKDIEELKPDAYELSIIAFLHMIFQNIYMLYKSSKKSEKFISIDADALLYRKMANFLYKNYHKKLSLDDIANSGSVSRSKCCMLFKKYTQNSPIEFLNLYRLEVSTSFLKNTTDNISTISLNCGFGQQSYYNRLFIREYGITPKEYRKSSL
ncbi:AraC family transcriptional regulator [Clostridium perfringens]|uniref:AraC family transcriptional regulator n=1 Tax=Clostridium perfringens TaxID=1502 RepID=UPI0028616A8C|nr:AraC family transcriptional regulator [Clostridium perfringens]ELC8345843.1 AraC family transcriptional regulator [Clostridium perfringens]